MVASNHQERGIGRFCMKTVTPGPRINQQKNYNVKSIDICDWQICARMNRSLPIFLIDLCPDHGRKESAIIFP